MATVYAGRWAEPITGPAGASLPSATITVYLADGVTPATLYVDRLRSSGLANPLPIRVAVGSAGLDVLGNATWFADPDDYVVAVELGAVEVYRSSVACQRDPDEPGGGGGSGLTIDPAQPPQPYTADFALVVGQFIAADPLGNITATLPDPTHLTPGSQAGVMNLADVSFFSPQVIVVGLSGSYTGVSGIVSGGDIALYEVSQHHEWWPVRTATISAVDVALQAGAPIGINSAGLAVTNKTSSVDIYGSDVTADGFGGVTITNGDAQDWTYAGPWVDPSPGYYPIGHVVTGSDGNAYLSVGSVQRNPINPPSGWQLLTTDAPIILRGLPGTNSPATDQVPALVGSLFIRDHSNAPEMWQKTGVGNGAWSGPFSLSGFVGTSRQVLAGSGLTGGGPLTSDVTLAADSTQVQFLAAKNIAGGYSGLMSTGGLSVAREPSTRQVTSAMRQWQSAVLNQAAAPAVGVIVTASLGSFVASNPRTTAYPALLEAAMLERVGITRGVGYLPVCEFGGTFESPGLTWDIIGGTAATAASSSTGSNTGLGGYGTVLAAQRTSAADGHTNGTTTVTSASAAFTQADVGALITGTDIPPNAYIVSVTNSTTVVISAAASGTTTTAALTISQACHLTTAGAGANIDGIVVDYSAQPGVAGTGTVYIDNVSAGTLAGQDAALAVTTSGYEGSYSAGAAGAHHVVVANTSTAGTFILDGGYPTLANRTAGIRLNRAQHQGWGITDYIANPSTLQWITKQQPSLVVSEINLDDYINHGVSATALGNLVASWCADVHAAAPFASHLFVYDLNPYLFAPATWTTTYRDACRRAVEADVDQFGDPLTIWVDLNDAVHPYGKRTTSADGHVTSGLTTLTSASAAFRTADTGAALTGTGIATGATIATVNSATSVTMSLPASGTATTSAVTISQNPQGFLTTDVLALHPGDLGHRVLAAPLIDACCSVIPAGVYTSAATAYLTKANPAFTGSLTGPNAVITGPSGDTVTMGDVGGAGFAGVTTAGQSLASIGMSEVLGAGILVAGAGDGSTAHLASLQYGSAQGVWRLGNFLGGTGLITNSAAPVAAADLANKAYVDAAVANLGPVWDAVVWATAAALPANSYAAQVLTATSNGALTIDGNTPSVGDRVLVKNEATGSHNGIYTVTTVGTGSTKYVLTRSSDGSLTSEFITGKTVFVTSGTANGGTTWNLTTTAPVLDTTAMTFAQVGGPGYVVAGTGLAYSGVTLGLTVPVSVANGGTGVTALSSIAVSSLGAPAGSTMSWNVAGFALQIGDGTNSDGGLHMGAGNISFPFTGYQAQKTYGDSRGVAELLNVNGFGALYLGATGGNTAGGVSLIATANAAATAAGLWTYATSPVVPAPSSTGQAVRWDGLPRILHSVTSPTGNGADTTEDTLDTYTTAAGQLATLGDCIQVTWGGTTDSSTAGTKRFRAYFAGTAVFDSTAVAGSAAGSWQLDVMIVRVSSTSVVVTASYNATGFSAANVALAAAVNTTITGLTLSGTNIIKLTGTSGTTATANRMVVTNGEMQYTPAAL